jgi:D-3-phosphoglycerate dehydrogenase
LSCRSWDDRRIRAAALDHRRRCVHGLDNTQTERAVSGILRNRDVLGVIGRVGTVLGGVGVNIAEYHQARLEQGGEALAAISVDGWVWEDALAALRRLGDVIPVKQVQLD